VYQIIDFNRNWNHANNALARAAFVPVFLCPSEPTAAMPAGWAGTTYRANQGSEILYDQPSTNPSNQNFGMPAPNGVFVPSRSLKMADVIDGASNTAAFSEHPFADFNNGTANEFDTFQPGTYPATPDESLEMCRAVDTTDLSTQGVSNVGAPWLQSYHSTTQYFHVHPPNERSCMYPPGRIAPTAASYPEGGVHVTLCDGSVRFVSENIDLGTWRAIGTRDGKEVIGEF
jgi:hypothetical protein